jgi:uncharacterized alkaline shock family protein YloU
VAQPDLKANLPARELRGDVTVADGVIAKLAGRAALLTYGVIDMRRSLLSPITRLFSPVARLLFSDDLGEGVDVYAHESHADIVLHVVIERGLNLAEVTRTLEEQVRFEVERVAGVRVGDVRVRVEDVRR